jgi:hypothetical protein
VQLTEGVPNTMFIARRNVPAVAVAAIVMAGGAQLMVRSADLSLQNSRGDWTAIELFVAGVRSWDGRLLLCLGR